jgi:hypothetical protein
VKSRLAFRLDGTRKVGEVEAWRVAFSQTKAASEQAGEC